MAAKPYAGRNHGTFDEEWGCHRRVSEWWYATGYFETPDRRMFSFQYTVIRPFLSGLRPNILMTALTDFATGKHHYSQKVSLFGRKVNVDDTSIRFDDSAELRKGPEGMRISLVDNEFSLDLALSYGKGAVWHCDNGLLKMGTPDTRETTTYYSYTNMPTAGTLTLNGETAPVTGKSWFDRQGGPYRLMNRKTHWEWFSLRFYDDEEMMLFSFPQNGYRDGTYIRRSGASARLTDYSITPTAFITVEGNRYSAGWTLSVPGLKEESYVITPLLPAQRNLGYLEQLAGVFNSAGERVGMCFVELLPGVWNEKYARKLLRRTG